MNCNFTFGVLVAINHCPVLDWEEGDAGEHSRCVQQVIYLLQAAGRQFNFFFQWEGAAVRSHGLQREWERLTLHSQLRHKDMVTCESDHDVATALADLEGLLRPPLGVIGSVWLSALAVYHYHSERLDTDAQIRQSMTQKGFAAGVVEAAGAALAGFGLLPTVAAIA